MKIAFDVHGTIGQYPHVFKPVMFIMMEAGLDVCILSGPPADQVKAEMDSLEYIFGKHYTAIYSVVDYLREMIPDQMRQDDLGHWWTNDKTWWASKGGMCQKFEIDVLVDNELKYKPFLMPPTKFIHWER